MCEKVHLRRVHMPVRIGRFSVSWFLLSANVRLRVNFVEPLISTITRTLLTVQQRQQNNQLSFLISRFRPALLSFSSPVGSLPPSPFLSILVRLSFLLTLSHHQLFYLLPPPYLSITWDIVALLNPLLHLSLLPVISLFPLFISVPLLSGVSVLRLLMSVCFFKPQGEHSGLITTCSAHHPLEEG